MQEFKVEQPKEKSAPQIMTGIARDADGKIKGVYMTDFKAGKVIQRCGKSYRLMPDGSQRRVVIDSQS
jgi:hypothetical protein